MMFRFAYVFLRNFQFMVTPMIYFLWNILLNLFNDLFKKNTCPTFIVTNQTLCHDIFSKDIMKRPYALGMGDFFARWLGSCLGCLDSRDPKWAQLKRIFKPLFDRDPDLSINSDWEENLVNLFDQSTIHYKPISVYRVVNNLPLYFVFKILVGKTFVAKFKTTIDSLQSLSNELMCISFNHTYAKNRFYRYLPTKENNKLLEFMNRWEKLLEDATRDASVMTEGIFHQLLENYNHSGLEWEYFSQTLIEITFANQDVTIPSLAWLLIHYMLEPKWMNCDPQHFIEESARISPISKYSMPKTTTKKFIIDNKLYGTGTTVVVDFEALGHNADWKMDDLQQFNPDRFNKIQKTYFISRFGYGSRHCPGNNLTNKLFTYVINHLRKNWRLLPTSPTISISDIKKDPSNPFFNNPIQYVHLLPSSLYNKTSVYYHFPPCAEIIENAFMAVSVNSRSPFLSDRSASLKVVRYLSDRHKNKKVLILICDDISKYNLQAFDGYSATKAVTKAAEMGNMFINIFTEAINECKTDNVIICRWKDIVQYDIPFIEKNKQINERVSDIAEKFLQYRGQGIVSKSYQTKIDLVKKYIFSEIGVLILGVFHNKCHYRVLYYCGTKDHLSKFAGDPGSLHHLILSIYNDPAFKQIRDKIINHSLDGLLKVQGTIGIEL